MIAATKESEEALTESTRIFAAIGDPARLRILNLIRHGGEVCNCQIAPITGYLPPKISRHLALLKQAGLIAERRAGNFRHYRLLRDADPLRKRLFALLDSLAADNQLLLEDRRRLDDLAGC